MALLWRTDGPLLLDAAMGTRLHHAGLPLDLPPEAWLLERHEEIRRVHQEAVAAGAHAVLTCTFNAHPASLRGCGLPSYCGEIRRMAVAVAREAGAPQVVGVVGPLRPGTPAGEVQLMAEAAAQDRVRAGVDALLVETVVDLDEGLARLAGSLALGVPVVATVVPGTPAAAQPAHALAALKAHGAHKVGFNCASPDEVASVMGQLPTKDRLGLWLKPSAGTPEAPLSAQAWAAGMARLLAEKPSAVGGCCGTGPQHLEALRDLLEAEVKPARKRGHNGHAPPG